jgi:hypothetical protein
MPKSISPAEWKKAVAEQKQRNKQLMEEREAAITEDAPATEPTEEVIEVAPESTATTVVAEPAKEPEPAPEAPEEPVVEDVEEVVTADTDAVIEEATPVAEDAPVIESEELVTDNTSTESLSFDDLQKSFQDLSNRSSDKKTSPVISSIHFGRIGNGAREVKSIAQPDFAKLCSKVLLGESMPETFEITCTLLNKSNRVALWEEGGSYLGNGNVLMITDAYGNPKDVVAAYHDHSKVCGKHALIPISLYDHLVIGVRNDTKKCIGIYRIDTITPSKPKMPGVAICTRVVLDVPRDEDHDDITVSTNLKSYEANWLCGADEKSGSTQASTKLDKILTIADQALCNEDASSPIYIKKYYKYYLNKADYDKVLQDQDYVAKLTKYNTVTELYEAFDKVSTEYLNTHDVKREDFVCVVSLQLYMLQSGRALIAVIVSGLVYPKVIRPKVDKQPNANAPQGKQTKQPEYILPETTPEGRIYYGYAFLGEDELFYYPDENADMKIVRRFSHIVDKLKERKDPTNGKYTAETAAFRCLC